MQSTIFAMAAQYESFRSYLNTYAECEEQTAMIIDEARLFVVSPLRDVLVDAKQALAQKPNKKIAGGVPLEQYRYNLAQEQLPEHAKLFEKHRLGYLKGVLKNLVYSELKYHCRVIEELTPLLALLSDDTSATVDAETLVHFS